MFQVWGFNAKDTRPYLVGAYSGEEEACHVAEEEFDSKNLARSAVFDDKDEPVFVLHCEPTPYGKL